MIGFNTLFLALSKEELKALGRQSIAAADALSESVGESAASEKEVLLLLKEICEIHLPALFEGSARLVESISQEVNKADRLSASFFGR